MVMSREDMVFAGLPEGVDAPDIIVDITSRRYIEIAVVGAI